MPKDNENFPFLTVDGPPEPSARQSFAPEQMVRCDECLRANPPTRVSCLYCAAVLPVNETVRNLQKPALRPLEKWERGYNTILLPRSANLPPINAGETALAEAADALRLNVADLSRILSFKLPLPLARAATIDEAELVERRLTRLEIGTMMVSDAELGLDENGPIKIRAMDINSEGVSAYQTPELPVHQFEWSDLELVVVGRLTVKRVELKEEQSSRGEKQILDASEFFTDEAVLDLYTSKQTTLYRIVANSFDFSCLGNRKGLVAGKNLFALLDLFRERAANAEFDDSYNSARKALEAVWPSQQDNDSRGWHRERPGKYSVGTVTEVSNETQFQRYSRLRYFVWSKLKATANEDS